MRTLLLLLVATLTSLPLAAQETVTVETFLPPGSNMDDALIIGPNGDLYGSRFGTFGTPGTTVTRVDLPGTSTSEYATGLMNSNGLGFTSNGNLYIASYGDATVRQVTPGGTLTTYATAGSGNLSGLLVHPDTDVIYVTNCTNNTVDIVESNGTFTPFLSNDSVPPELNCPVGLAVDDDGTLYVSNFSDGKIMRVSGGGAMTEIADLDGPADNTTGFITYAAGSLFATGIGSHVIEEVKLPGGEISTLAGTGAAGNTDGPADVARFNAPNGIVATPTGDTLYVSDYNTQAIRRIIRSSATANEPNEVPASTSRLMAPYPNPVSERATIPFELKVAEHVTLSVYDVLGRRVSVVSDKVWPAGQHSVALEGNNLAPGTYVVRLATTEEIESRRLMIAK